MILTAVRRPSLAEQLFRISPIPVLAVPLGRRRRSPQVLVPIEDSASLQLIPQAAILARMFRSGMTFVAAESQDLLPRARDLAERELVSSEVTLVADDLASTLLELIGVVIVMRSPSPNVVARLLRESRVPLLVIRHPPTLPDPGESKPIELPVRLAAHRVPRNPFEGMSAP